MNDDSQFKDFETQPIEFDPVLHAPPRFEPPKPPEPHIPKLSLLTKPTPFDEEAVNADFQDEYERLEQRSRQLDLNFQDLVKDLRLWICASTSPVSEEAKLTIAEEVENIKEMERSQEDLRIRIVDCMKAVEMALSILNNTVA